MTPYLIRRDGTVSEYRACSCKRILKLEQFDRLGRCPECRCTDRFVPIRQPKDRPAGYTANV